LLRSDSFWNWKYKENPFGESTLTVAETDDKIVGFDNLWPWEFNVNGVTIRAVQPCDSVVHPNYRGSGILKTMRIHGMEIVKRNGVQLLFNFPNKYSLRSNISLGWHFMGKVKWWVKILKPVDVLYGRLSPGKAESVAVDSEYSLDMDLIKQTVENTLPNEGLLNINRKYGFHEWRYIKHPTRSYGMVHYNDGTSSIIAIFTLNQNIRTRELVLVDFIGSCDNTLGIIDLVLDVGKQMNAGYVAIMDNPVYLPDKLWQNGFIPFKFKNMVTMPLDFNLNKISRSYSNWSLMASMHDSI